LITARIAREIRDPALERGFIQVQRSFRQTKHTAAAKAAFFAIVDTGTIGLKAAMAGAPYA
jgi:lipid A disaccharide synthetase